MADNEKEKAFYLKRMGTQRKGSLGINKVGLECVGLEVSVGFLL